MIKKYHKTINEIINYFKILKEISLYYVNSLIDIYINKTKYIKNYINYNFYFIKLMQIIENIWEFVKNGDWGLGPIPIGFILLFKIIIN